MESKDWWTILVLLLSICHGRGLRGVAGDDRSTAVDDRSTAFGKSNFFQDKFCDHFCPKDGSQPRLTLTDEQIETILNSEEILKMLEDNPGLLHDDKALDSACLIKFNDDQRDSILAQYGAFFSTQDELELLEESARSINFADNVDPDKTDWDMLDKLLETNNPNPARSTEKKEPTASDEGKGAGKGNSKEQKQQETKTEDTHNNIWNYRSYNRGSSSSSSSSGSSSSNSGSNSGSNSDSNSGSNSGSDSGSGSQSNGRRNRYYGSSRSSGSNSGSNSGSSSGSNSRSNTRSNSRSGSGSNGWRNQYYSSSSSSGSDSRWRRKRRGTGEKTLEERQKLLDDFIQKNSLRKRSQRMRTRSNRAARVKRNSDLIPLCQAAVNVEAIQLALTVNGVLVQVPQFPETELYQWFVKETCLEDISSVLEGVSCNRTSRSEKAIVMNLDGLSGGTPLFEGLIVVESCSAFVSASAAGAEAAEVVDESPSEETPAEPPAETPAPPPAEVPTEEPIPT